MNTNVVIHRASDLEHLFNTLFVSRQNTLLAGGFDEPLYQPAGAAHPQHRVHYTRDYFASALHEVAHWCVAGRERRQLEDYGYWYAPDGRNPAQQTEFEQVEVKPQALEWLFSAACNFRFRVSADNLALSCGPSAAFKSNITLQVHDYLTQGIPHRAHLFCDVLAQHYGGDFLAPEQYCVEALA